MRGPVDKLSQPGKKDPSDNPASFPAQWRATAIHATLQPRPCARLIPSVGMGSSDAGTTPSLALSLADRLEVLLLIAPLIEKLAKLTELVDGIVSGEVDDSRGAYLAEHAVPVDAGTGAGTIGLQGGCARG